jgi:RND superfamily putative drug exporter
VAVSIALAVLAAVTLLPAMLVLAGRRGWVTPRGSGNNRFWRVLEVRIVRRPRTSP